MTHPEPEPIDDVKTITAELLDRLTLDANGQPFDDKNPETWQAADEAEPEVVSLGFAKCEIVDVDATALALAAGAIDETTPETLCLRVRFADDDRQPSRRAGQYITLDAMVGIKLLFLVWALGEDVHASAPEGFDLGPGTDNEALKVLQPGEALLVQVVVDEEDAEAAQ